MRRPATALGPRASRTIARILDATRDIFLTQGYAGTTIDEIARAAGVSRASFYTYFPSKRDVLLALGANSKSTSGKIVKALGDADPAARHAAVATFVTDYFEVLNDHGSFALAWMQAAQEDNEIKVAGLKGHLEQCRRIGIGLGNLRGVPFDDPAHLGMVVYGAIERGWQCAQLYAPTVDRQALIDQVVALLDAIVATAPTAG